MTEREIFTAALAREDRNARDAFLDEICAGNSALRQRIESLLVEHQQLGSFMDVRSQQVANTVDMPGAPLVAERPGAIIGPYKLLQQIGEGGMGVVYMAEQAAPVRRKVALKIIKPGMDTREVIARFEAERQALALMDHPNIARIFDAGMTGDTKDEGGRMKDETAGSVSSKSSFILPTSSFTSGRPYFVMELVHGIPITDYCDQNSLPVHVRLELFILVCHAVQHAHQKGIIHRDLKPSNVLVTMHDGHPIPKVIDFGVAKAIGQQLTDKTLFTQFAQMVGTPLYMSPEQAQLTGKDVDTRGDIYSLGVLLYELLTGTTPFERGRLKQAALDEIRRMIREEDPPSPSARLSSTVGETQTAVAAHRHIDPKGLSRLVRGDLDWIVMKALEKDRNRRYETANGFAADIGRYLSDEPVEACPPSSMYRLRKLVRRNRGTVLAASLVVIALVGGIIGTTLGLIRATDAEMVAVKAANEKELALDAVRESEQNAKDQLFLALVNQARAERSSGRVGQRFEALKAIRQAAQVRITPELRTEAIAALVLPDTEVAQEWQAGTGDILSVAFDATLQRYARIDEQGRITVCRLNAGRESVIARLPAYGQPPYHGLWMSPDGRFVAYGHSCVRQAVPGEVRVWEFDRASPSVALDVPEGMHMAALAFQPGGLRLAVGHADSSISIYNLTNGQHVQRLKVDSAPIQLAFHPRGDRLAVACGNAVQLFVTDSGDGPTLLRHPAAVTWLAWHPDGRRLAAGCDDRKIHLWDTESATEVMAPWSGHVLDGIAVAFNHAGDRLISSDWGQQSRLWDTATGRVLLTSTANVGTQFSPDDGLIGREISANHVKISRLAAGSELRVLRRRNAGSGENIHSPVVHADGRILAAGTKDSVCFFDLTNGEELASIRLRSPNAARPICFVPPSASAEEGNSIEEVGGWITGGNGDLLLWPARSDRSHAEVTTVGPPQRLSYASAYASGASASADGRVIAIPQGDSTHVYRRDRPGQPVVLGPQYDVRFSAVSPDGAWVATCSHWSDGRSVSVRIWDADKGQAVSELPLHGSTSARFSPDGRWLMTCNSNGCRLWETGTWREVRRLGSHNDAGHAAFSPDGRLTAIGDIFNIIRLVETSTGREVARLTGPEPMWYAPACFTPDGTRLIASCSGNTAIYVWDLRLIRQQLRELGLDWEWDEFAPAVKVGESHELLAGESHEVRVIDPTALLDQAQSHVATRHWDEAFAAYGEAIRLSPNDAEAYFARGDTHATLGRWTPAAADYSRALELDPSDHFNWYRLTALRLSSGDHEGYRLGCREMLARFGQSDMPVEIADRVAKTCLLTSNAVDDEAHVQRLVERAITGTNEHRFYRWFLLTKGLAEYRAGRHAEAIEWLTRFGPREDGVHSNATAFALLAMAQFRLGRTNESLAALESAQKIITHSMPKPEKGQPFDNVNNWLDWLHPQLLCREAVELLGIREKTD
jgi:serine/threonine protein kinase/WD40 repeat protein/tetratricopeptide (TPR) repeat protein